MERATNRFGILAVHTLIWTLPFGLYWVLEQPSVSQRFYYQLSATTMAAAYFGLCCIRGDLHLPRNGVVWAAIVFGLIALLSGFAARSLAFTVKETAFLWCGVLLLIMVIHLRLTHRQCRGLLTSLVLVAAVCALYGVLQYLGFEIRWGMFGYAEEVKKGKSYVLSVLGHPNYVTAYVGPVLAVCPGLVATARTRRWRVVLGVAASVIALCVFLAGSRSAWLATLGVATALGLLAVRQRQSIRLGRRLLAGSFVAVGFLVLFAIPNPLVPHRYSFVERLVSARPIEGRLYFYLTATRMIADRPILGVGYGNYGVEFWDYAARIQAEPGSSIYRYILEDVGGIRADQTHNEFLQLAAETGVWGLAAYLFLLVVFYQRLHAGYGQCEEWPDRLLLAGVGGAVAFVLIDSAFGFPLRLACSSQVFWLALAIGSRYGWPATGGAHVTATRPVDSPAPEGASSPGQQHEKRAKSETR